MTYDKERKAQADAARYRRDRDRISVKRKAQRLADKLNWFPLADDPTPERLRNAIEDGKCPWCGKNSLRRLAGHTWKVHGIYADDIRKMAIMLKHAPTCTKEESESLSILRLRLLREGRAKLPIAQNTGRKMQYSEAGLIGMRNKQKHMIESITPEIARRAIEKAVEKTSKPHPCPVCGKIIPRAHPICCSKECRKKRQQRGLEIGHRLWYEGSPIPRGTLEKGRKLWSIGEYREKMMAILNEVRNKPKTHRCRVCGKLIRKSRPRAYCSPECVRNPFNLPIDEIKAKYLANESSVEIAKSYGCCDHTIRRQLKKIGVIIRQGNSNG
jgi:predicted nucleic acid-binding Zn ribbon protein